MIGRISSPRFVGRVAELEALGRLLVAADSRGGGAMLVVGEAGIGKSRLVAELETGARAADILVLRGECVELGEGELAFAPVISALRDVMEDSRTLDGLGTPLRSALAALWSVPGASEGGGDGRDLIYNGELFWLAVRLAADLAQEASVSGHATAAEQAREAATLAVAEFDRVIGLASDNRAPPEGIAFRALTEAELARLQRDHDPELWREAGEMFGKLDERLRVAYTRLREAEAMAARGADADEFRACVREAHETAIATGARPFQAQVETFAREVGLRLDAPKPSGDRAGETGKPATDEVLKLLGGARRRTRPDRILATILFTDIVGSTARAADLGDSRWRELLDQHDELVRAEVKRFGGVVVQFVGATGRLAPSTDPVARSTALARCERRSSRWGSRSAQAYTPGRSRFGETTLVASPSTSVRESPREPPAPKSCFLRPSPKWWRGQESSSNLAVPTSSKA